MSDWIIIIKFLCFLQDLLQEQAKYMLDSYLLMYVWNYE